MFRRDSMLEECTKRQENDDYRHADAEGLPENDDSLLYHSPGLPVRASSSLRSHTSQASYVQRRPSCLSENQDTRCFGCCEVVPYICPTYCGDEPWTKEQKMSFIILMVGTLTASLTVCLFPPFFPPLAELKESSYSLLGLIIGTSCLVSFLLTPFLGKHLNSIGPKFAFVMGSFVSAICCALSGLLQFFPHGAVFVAEAIAIRAVHATGNALVIVSTFTYIAMLFPDSMATHYAWTRTAMNVAQCFGPVLAGLLIDLQGFYLPFFVMGAVQLITTAFSVCCLAPMETEAHRTETPSLLSVIRLPKIWLSFYACIISTMSNGFLTINLEPLVLRKFHQSSMVIGAIFGLKDGVNSIASPIWGVVCDKGYPKVAIVISALLAAIAFVLLGPFPGLPLPDNLWICTVALALFGTAVAGLQVAGMVDASQTAVACGLSHDSATQGMVAGLWSSISSAGRFVSRVCASIIAEKLGFRNASSIVVVLNASVIIIFIIYWLFCKSKSRYVALETYAPLSNVAFGVSVTSRMDDSVDNTHVIVNFVPSPSEALITKSLEVVVKRKLSFSDSQERGRRQTCT